MSDPQVWTLIGVFAASIFGALTLVVTLTNRATTSAIEGLRAEMRGGFQAVDARFDAVDAKFEAIDAKFEAVDAKFEMVYTKLDALDRDVSALMKHVFRIPE